MAQTISEVFGGPDETGEDSLDQDKPRKRTNCYIEKELSFLTLFYYKESKDQQSVRLFPLLAYIVDHEHQYE